MKTTISARNETVKRNWYVVDASGKTLGRLASEVARRLRGKHKPEYTPHVDTGDYIVIINAKEIKVTGNKAKAKMYHHHTGFPGGIKTASFSQMMIKNPCRVMEIAIKGMLPKNALGREMYRKLKVYTGAEHPHAAQQPLLLDEFGIWERKPWQQQNNRIFVARADARHPVPAYV